MEPATALYYLASPVGMVCPGEHTHPPVAKLVFGGPLHTTCDVYGNTVVVGPGPGIVSALTRTGITAPVDRLKGM
jgi:hypothetical protein